jgi:hypothetical protein
MLLVCGLNKAAERNMIGRRLRRAESGWAQFQVPPDAVAFAPRRNETRSLSLMPALRVKSGTAGFATRARERLVTNYESGSIFLSILARSSSAEMIVFLCSKTRRGNTQTRMTLIFPSQYQRLKRSYVPEIQDRENDEQSRENSHLISLSRFARSKGPACSPS